MLLLPLPSWAGQWDATFSGTAQATPAQGAAQNYTIPNTSGPSVFYGEPASLTMTVTTTLTWTPSGPGDTSKPPPEAVLEEYLGAGGSVSSNPAGGVTIKANDGVGTAPITGSPQGGSSVEAQTDYYVGIPVPAGATSVQGPTRTLTASLAYSGSASNPLVWVDYGVGLVDNVALAPGGATSDGKGGYDILAGQRCSPALSVTDENGNSTTLSGTVTYQWSVSDASATFQSWTVSPDQRHTTEMDGPGPLNVEYPGWYWNEMFNTMATVSCTATVTPPTGEGSSFSVTVTQLVAVYTPPWTGPATGGAVGINNNYPGATGWVLYAGPASANEPAGMVWTPTEAPPAGTPLGDGTLSLVQLLTPDRSFSVSSGSYAQNLPQGLDTQYPYKWNTGAPNYEGQDSPAIGLTVSPVGGTASKAMMQDNFVDYLMYTPPGGVAVPLGQFSWGTNATVIEPKGGWGGGTAGTVTPQSGSFTANNPFPKWTSLINKNTPYVKQ